MIVAIFPRLRLWRCNDWIIVGARDGTAPSPTLSPSAKLFVFIRVLVVDVTVVLARATALEG